MLLKEFMEGGDLWGTINAESPFAFITEATPEKLNALTKYKHGKRVMYFDGTIAELAVLVVLEYKAQWDALVLAFAATDVTAGTLEKTTDNTLSTEQKTSSRNDVNKVSAFDTNDLIDSEGQTSSGTEGISGDKNRDFERRVTTVSDIYKNLDVLKKNAIIQTIINDVARFATLDIS